jgi:dipeptidyl aminopeptidase/acylaminoacyl peptidase
MNMHRRFQQLIMVLAALTTTMAFAQLPPPGEAPEVTKAKAELAMALKEPMAKGLDVGPALTAWFAGEEATGTANKVALFEKGLATLKGELKPLAQAKWPKLPDATLTKHDRLTLKTHPDIDVQIVGFTVDGLKQYGVMVRPKAEGKYPLIAYVHGAAFGVPAFAMGWLADIARRGYVVVGPAFRGEPLFAGAGLEALSEKYKSAGNIENLKGEPNDVLAIANAAMKEDFVKPDKYAIVGHSFGAGAGLLAATRDKKVAAVVSYDAWLVNAYRFYWERLRGGNEYYWGSWEEFCQKRTVPEQLAGLMKRSVVQHAEQIKAPTLLFIGELDAPGYHESHQDLFTNMKKAGANVRYEVAKGGGHNFVLYFDSEPALWALKIQNEWLDKYHPPVAPKKAE